MWAVLYVCDSAMFLNCWHKYRSNPLSVLQCCIQNPAKHLRWCIFRKQFTAKSGIYFCKTLLLRCFTWFWICLWCSTEERFWKTPGMESWNCKVAVVKGTTLQFFPVNFVNVLEKFIKAPAQLLLPVFLRQ